MKVHTVTASHLTSSQILVWSDIQRANPMLHSPYLRPEFTQAVARAHDNVEVAIWEEAGLPVAFLPYERTRWNSGRPVGNRLSDVQAVIAPATFTFDPLSVLHACHLSDLQFDHVLLGQSSFSPYVVRQEDAAYIDLSDGFEAYAARLEHTHSHRAARQHIFRKPQQKLRQLQRQGGTVRFEPHVADAAMLSALINWKSAQYRNTNSLNIVSFSWTRTLVHALLNYCDPLFSPLLSVLYAGKQVAAVHYGLRSGDVLHSWFPAYNTDMARCSPGLLLFIELFKAAASLGIRRIDLGTVSPFKRRYMSGVIHTGESIVRHHRAPVRVRRALRWLRERLRHSPLDTPARTIGHIAGTIDTTLGLS